jgi:hypothetical protein
LRFVFVVFLLSRLVIFSAMAVSPWVITPVAAREVWNLDNPLLRPLFRWDAGWYLSIARNGYSYDGNLGRQQNIAFFPLYPLTCRWCHAITRLSIPLCAVLLSHGAFLVGLVALYALITREIGSDVARSATLLLAFFPASFFFSTMYAESFFLALSVLAFAAFRRQGFIQGGIWAGLASATRVQGILLLVPLIFEGSSCLRDRRMRWRVILAGALAVSGLGLFMLYQWVAFGDPLAYARVKAQAWHRGFALPFGNIAEALRETFRAGFSPKPVDAWFGLLFVALALTLPSQLPRSYAVYTILSVAMPLFTEDGVPGLTRYVSVLFPGFMALGIIGRQARWIFWALLALFIVVLFYFSMLFAQWHWIN